MKDNESIVQQLKHIELEFEDSMRSIKADYKNIMKSFEEDFTDTMRLIKEDFANVKNSFTQKES